MDWPWVGGVVQTLVGVIVGGLVTLGTTASVETRRSRHQAAQRRSEQAEKAAEEIAATLIQLRDLTRQDIFRSQLPALELMRAEEALERKIELLTLRLTDADARTRIVHVMDLTGYDAFPPYLRVEARNHLIACCGNLMRGEPIPPESSAVLRGRAAVEEYLQLQDEGREEREREE
jgi:hypothetical protein